MIGNVLLIFSLILGSGLLFLTIYCEAKKREYDPLIYSGFNLLGILITVVVSVLTYYFFTNYNINYVFTHSSVDTPLPYKLSAVWAGQEGTFLLWAWATILSSIVLIKKREKFRRKTGIIVLSIGLILLAMVYLLNPFQTTISSFEDYAIKNNIPLDTILNYYRSIGKYDPKRGFIDGNGLNPFLMSPWMALHPPIVFIAYATLTVPFAASLIYFLERTGDWEEISRYWARFSWLFLTIGITIGGVWAYEELSYGGYWTWDPVETASLLLWVSLTAFMHASYMYRTRRKFEILGPALGLFTLIFVFYTTFITRSGILKSVHGYASTTVGPHLASFIIITTIISSVLVLRELSRKNIKLSKKKPSISISTAQYLAVVVFIGISVVLLWGLTYPVIMKILKGVEIPTTKEFFNKWCFLLIDFAVLLTGFCLLLGTIKKDHLLKLAGGAVIINLLIGIIGPVHTKYFNYSIFFVVFALFGIGYRVFTILKQRNMKRIIKRIGPQLIHLGMVLIIIGVVTSTVFEKEYRLVFQYPQEIGTMKDFGGHKIKLNGLDIQNVKGNWYQYVRFEIIAGENSLGEEKALFIDDARYGQYPKVKILRGIVDFYVVFYGYQSNLILISIKTIPLVSLIWIGSILLCAGIALQLIPAIVKNAWGIDESY